MGLWLARGLMPLAVVLLFALPLVGSASASSTLTPAAAPGAPTLMGAFIINHGEALAFVGYIGWVGAWVASGSGGQIYSDAFDLYFFNLRTSPAYVEIGLVQNGAFVSNQTLLMYPVTEVGVVLSLPANTGWVHTSLLFDNVTYWTGTVATPVSLLPSYLLNVGAIDLMGLTIVSFMVLNLTLGAWLAKRAIRRAVWAPKFSLIIWGHVILFMLAGVVFLNYQVIDATFAGWSPLVYPWLTFPMGFFFYLSLFNRASKGLILQGTATSGGDMGYRATVVRAGPLADGRSVFVDERWAGFFARFFHHHMVMDDGDPRKTPPFMAPVEVMPSPTEKLTVRKRFKRRGDAGSLAQTSFGPNRLFAFPVVNPNDEDLTFIAWGKTGEPIRLVPPHLSIHRTVTLPAIYAPSPTTGAPPIMVREARLREKLTWPHYVDGPTPIVELEDKHYRFGAAVWAEFASIRDLSRVVSKLGSELAVLKASFRNLVQDELYSRLRIIYSLTGRPASGLSEAEAAEASGRLGSLLREERRGP